MAKKYDDTVLDGALAIADNATTVHVTSAEPANHAGIAAVSLADVTVTAGAGNGAVGRDRRFVRHRNPCRWD
jgi:hypothetical protein